jgi:hypothetical protein
MINIVMPFSRPFLINQIKKNYKDCSIILHPIQHENIEWGEDWIQPLLYEDRKAFDICYDKLNFFKETYPIIDEDYYWTSGDDDYISPELIEKIKEMNYDIIVVSLDTGTDVPTQGSICFNGILFAHPNNMGEWHCGLSQIIMKGEFYKEIKYRPNTNTGDGLMAEDIIAKYPDKIHYESALSVLHNYYQPGRWERLGDKSFYEGI